jgi:hypothetical protein
MADLTFEPYSTTIHFHVPVHFDRWQEVLPEFIHTLAQKCTRIGTVIGHIKALSLLDNQGFIRLSAVDRNHPVSLEGKVPTDCQQLDLSINILVFGLSHEIIEQIAVQATDEVSKKWNVKVEIKEEPENHTSQHVCGYN